MLNLHFKSHVNRTLKCRKPKKKINYNFRYLFKRKFIFGIVRKTLGRIGAEKPPVKCCGGKSVTTQQLRFPYIISLNA